MKEDTVKCVIEIIPTSLQFFWNDLGVCNSLIVLWIALSNCRLVCQDYTHYNLATIR